jgi:hypothetical protein
MSNIISPETTLKKPFEKKKSFLPQKSEIVAKSILPNCIINGIHAKTSPIKTTSIFLVFIINGRATPRTPPTKEFKAWMNSAVLI